MTTKKCFTKKEIWNMNEDAFSQSFYSKRVKVYFEDGSVENGFVSEIGLAANQNIGSDKCLPVSMKVDNHNIFITNIRQIELL